MSIECMNFHELEETEETSPCQAMKFQVSVLYPLNQEYVLLW